MRALSLCVRVHAFYLSFLLIISDKYTHWKGRSISSVLFVLLPTCSIPRSQEDFKDLNYISLSLSSLGTRHRISLTFGHFSILILFSVNCNCNPLLWNSWPLSKKITSQILVPPGRNHLQERNKSEKRKKKNLVSWMFSKLPLPIFSKQQTQRKKFNLANLVQTATSALFLRPFTAPCMC